MVTNCNNCRYKKLASDVLPCKMCSFACDLWELAEKTEETTSNTENLVQKAFDLSLEIVRDRNASYGDSWKEYRVGTYIDRAVVKTRRLRSLDEQGLGEEKLLDQALDLINELAFLVIKIKGWDK